MRQNQNIDNKGFSKDLENPSPSANDITACNTSSYIYISYCDNLATKAKISKNAMHKYQEDCFPRYVSTGKRPFVVWKYWDEHTKKYVRQKVEIKDAKEAEIFLYSVKGELINGVTIDSSTIEPQRKKKQSLLLKDLCVKFLDDKKDLKASTNYSSRVKTVIDWLNTLETTLEAEKVTVEDIKSFFAYYKEKGNGARELNNKRAFIKSVFIWGVEKELVTNNPVGKTKKAKEYGVQRATFSQSHLREMWKSWKAENVELYNASRFLFYSFIRPGEMIQLLLSDVDLRTMKIKVRGEVGKTGLGYVKITPPLFEVMKDMGFLERRGAGYLFENEDGTPIPEDRWQRQFTAYRRKNKLPEQYKFYCFKHTGVREHYLSGNNLLWIQAQCRHKDLATTIHYLQTGLGLDTHNDFPYFEPIL